MNIYDYIAYQDGSIGTIWGPCLDGSKENCDCKACQNADRINEAGLDFDEEYEKAMARNFDRKT